jgi:hypothetical protein
MIPIPPFLWKLIGGVVVIGGLCGLSYLKGRAHVQQAWDAAITEQATRTAQQMIAEAAHAADVEKRAAEVKTVTKTKLKIVEKEVIKYVQSPDAKCEPGPHFVRTWDDLSGVYNADLQRMPATDASPEQPDALPGPSITSAEVLRAYHTAIQELAGWRDAYRALVQYEEGRGIIQRTYDDPAR